jgi:rhodanese-related sulfurtransferase
VSDYQRIDVAEAQLIAARDDAALLDGARNVTESNLPQLLEGLSKSAPLVIYCYHGNSSQMVARFFAAQGFSEVYSVDGGYEAWRAAS